MAETLFLHDSEPGLQSQRDWDSVGTLIGSMTPEDALPSNVHSDTDRDTNERVTAAGGAPDPPSAIAVLAARFVENVKVKFGDGSHETTSIFGALGKFKNGVISKREAISTVSETLSCDYDLKRDLLGILHHQQARWGIDDFDMPLLPTEQSTPQFLQPAHEPQMRLPSLFTPWESSSRFLTPQKLAVMSGFEKHPSFEQSHGHGVSVAQVDPGSWDRTNQTMFSSSAASDHLVEPTTDQLTLPGIDHNSEISIYSNFDHRVGTAASHPEEGDDLQRFQEDQLWNRVDYGSNWAGAGLAQLGQHEEFLGSDPYLSLSASLEDPRPKNLRLHRRSESVIAVSPRTSSAALPEDPRDHTVPICEPAVDMPPPPGKRNRKSLVLEVKLEERQANVIGKHEPDVKEDQPSRARSLKQSWNHTPASRKYSQIGGAYIHSLCGKSFNERSKVKKHHWGNRNDDLNTTTGCWHKQKRPNVSWDDHASCKDVPRPAPRNSRRARSATEDSKAPVVPAMVPNYRNVIPGFPTLQDLPRNVATAVRSPHTPSPFAQDGNVYSGAMQDGYLPYHTHRLPRSTIPPSSPLENLLTVVNAAAESEKPTQEGRNDSVVNCDLDAQAIAAERTGHYTPAWAFSSYHPAYDAHYQQYMPSPTGTGFSIVSQSPAQHMSGKMASSRSGSIDCATSSASPTFSTLVYANQLGFMQHDEGYAIDQELGVHPVHD